MSALAVLLLKRGVIVSGSDLTMNPQLEALGKLGAKIHVGHKQRNVPANCDMVVINGAIADDNPELVFAHKKGVRVVERPELLAHIARGYESVIAVGGTHGKSTTTAMIGKIFTDAGLDPTVHNGAVGIDYENPLSNLTIGSTKFFITEACEFKRSFLALKPTVAVITNIGYDHIDCYASFDELKQSFKQFSDNAKVTITPHACQVENITQHQDGRFSFDIYADPDTCYLAPITCHLSVPGYHNVLNALAAIGVARHFRIPTCSVVSSLSTFKGISRRFETLGHIGKCQIISDYAHHPNEIRTTIETASSLFQNFLLVFQPHTYTRTKALFPEFISTLSHTNLILFETYSAREVHIPGGHSRDLASSLGTKHYKRVDSLVRALEKLAPRYDAIIVTGAGDLDPKLRNKLFRKSFCE